jgi:hypothetical protein
MCCAFAQPHPDQIRPHEAGGGWHALARRQQGRDALVDQGRPDRGLSRTGKRGFRPERRRVRGGLVVEKDTTNPNRVNVLWPGTLINQLRIFAMLVQFRLS